VVLVHALGRLAFEPTLPDACSSRRSRRATRLRRADVPGAVVVSGILPLVNRFYWGYFDFQWYPEASWSQAGFVGVRDFIAPKFPPMREDEDGDTPRVMSVRRSSPARRRPGDDAAGRRRSPGPLRR
jgi:hypothetical protein